MSDSLAPSNQKSGFLKAALFIIGGAIAFGVMAKFFGVGSPAVSCTSKSNGLGGIIHISNGCDFPVNAVNCRQYTFRGEYCHFKQYRPGEMMETLSNGSILGEVVFPSYVYTYACKVGYTPKIRSDNKTKFKCESGGSTVARQVSRSRN